MVSSNYFYLIIIICFHTVIRFQIFQLSMSEILGTSDICSLCQFQREIEEGKKPLNKESLQITTSIVFHAPAMARRQLSTKSKDVK